MTAKQARTATVAVTTFWVLALLALAAFAHN